MRRRDFLRLTSLAALAVGAAPVLAACGPAAEPGPAPAAGDLDLVAADLPRAAGDPAAVPAVVAGLARSGGALLGRLAAAAPGDNLVLSPCSIATALAMTATGAAGVTRTQLEQAIGGVPVAQAGPGLNALAADLEALAGDVRDARGDTRSIELATADALFGQRGVNWRRGFLEALATDFGAGVRAVDFTDDAEGARAAVNGWAAEQTRDRIPEILPPGSVGPTTRLVLADALHLEAPWHLPFDEDLTEDGDFTLPDGATASVPLMRAGKPLALATAAGEGWQAVRLPYAGEALAMTVVVPDAGSYDAVEADVVAGGLASYLAVPETDVQPLVDLALPRWTFRTSTSLKRPLQDLGVEAPFTDADFSPMTGDLDLVVDDVRHEVFIAVDEAGTEAAAVTAVVMAESAAPVVDLELTVDRPFLFCVHDVEHGAPLFLGRVLDPRG
ncbi:serpin family protein [Nocardioides litoris]|uniref:serpin family protein n=1 Tax=Nocardioides litoris TaxID=1926648 RepID=UPI00111CB13E|nr:serpin family protein [Nocardioides litoris]